MAKKWIKVAAIVALALAAAPALAVQPDEMLKDPALETRARSLSHELRCMVCQNQSIDDSDAPLARDLRILVRERLTAGDSDARVVDFLVARYGEFVLLRPRLAWHTLMLWLAPPVVLLGGAIALALGARRRTRGDAGRGAPGEALTEVEQQRVAELLTAKEH